MAVARRSGHIENTDIQQHSTNAGLAKVSHSQLSCGSFRSQTDYIKLPGMTFYHQVWNQRVSARGESPEDSIFLCVTSHGMPSVSWCETEIDDRRFIWEPPRCEIDFVSDVGTDHVVLILNKALLREVFDAETVSRLLRSRHCLASTIHNKQQFTNTVQKLIKRYSGREESLGDAVTRKAINLEIFDLLDDMLTGTHGQNGYFADTKRAKALSRALQLIESAEESISVGQLARGVGACQRTLEYAFRDRFGITPVRYLRWSRLNALHRDLCIADPRYESVGQAALRHGFTELGRMAGEYRHLFGRLPSESLVSNPPRTTPPLHEVLRAM